MPRGGGMKDKASPDAVTSKPLKPRGRAVGGRTCRPALMERRCPALPNQLRSLVESTVAEPPGGTEKVFGPNQPPTEPAPARAPGDRAAAFGQLAKRRA